MNKRFLNQSGQTLIETMVAVLILSVGIGSAVSLATYALGATQGVTKQLIGVGLAREGVEAVKNIRDTNWLKTSLSTNCFDFYNQSNVASCYTSWLIGGGSGTVNIDPGSTATYALGYNRNNPEFWTLISTANNFGLNYDVGSPDTGIYSPGISGVSSLSATSDFSRKITLTADNSFAPFNQNTGPRLKVTVDVWWKDKRCAPSNDVPTTSSCKVRIETYLTNWKTY